LQELYLIIVYLVMVAPSLLLIGETKSRFLNLKMGTKALAYLPLTVLPLMAFVIFGVSFLSTVPLLNASWLGYNIAIGPFGNQGLFGILPFLPILLYTLIHVNYVEELYFRKDITHVVIWAALHIAMGVAVYVTFALIPLGLFYKFIKDRYDVNHAYTLHFATNIVIISISLSLYMFL
jgi:membrane protease YdiL (CAAX protease family)